jgi:hypothetical protein
MVEECKTEDNFPVPQERESYKIITLGVVAGCHPVEAVPGAEGDRVGDRAVPVGIGDLDRPSPQRARCFSG